MAFSRGWERKLTSKRFATGWLSPCIWRNSSVGKDQVNNWEFRILKIRPTVCFCSDSTDFFHLECANALYDFYWESRSYYFHSLIKSTFLVSTGLLCLYDKQNSIWLLLDISLVSYLVKLSRKNSMYTRSFIVLFIFTVLSYHFKLIVNVQSRS